jgi:ketosteroid isomerase-like protein
VSDDATIIAEREKALYAALTASDADALADVLSDDVTYIHSTGIAETKQENMAGQRNGVHKHGPIKRLHGKTQISGDLAVTRGVIDMVDTAHGAPFTLRLCESLVWIREAGTWRLLLRHATRLPL